MTKLLTVGDLHRIVGEPIHRIVFAIGRFGPEPAAQVGATRVWTPDQVPAVQESLRRTAERSTVKDAARRLSWDERYRIASQVRGREVGAWAP